ncbi:lasso peptide biosynthesis B2 protein [Limnofasciculus baicalensis]|uniref:Lasso peptide biosynthesis B2 protein n=1 Tax=Limnofasciculus baicalensis BBK-W-15 TaxID=2699891 RepID=A0AAE3GXW4_9CYAN|nr:lasso peptide biosynthesis B2 protein [Limnofasciculus baicalensis]MCP2732620.1 lasso peptide biosynthesis B2 protein [Limnofasciculus baicalensis BBK-W-15]
MKQLLNFLQMTWCNRKILITAFILLGLVRLGLWLLPFQRLQRLLVQIGNIHSHSQNNNQTSINKIIWAVETSSRYMPGVKCLARALTTQTLMSRYGHSSELRIGVAKGESGKLEAHAWIESQGKVIIGYLAELSRFVPMEAVGGGRL